MWMVLGPMLSILNYEVVPVGGRPGIGCPLQYKRILARDGTDPHTTLNVNNTLLQRRNHPGELGVHKIGARHRDRPGITLLY